MTSSRYDVVGIGNAIVDIIGRCDDAFLARHDAPKGHMRLVDPATLMTLYNAMGPAVEISGGSAANTIAGVASFGGKTGFIGKIANDEFGRIFSHDIRGQGVTFAGKPVSDGTIRFEGPAGVSENADLDGEGKYQVRSHLGAGLPSGVYRVAVLPRVAVRSDSPPLAGAAPPEDPTKEFPHIPPKFRNIETSELKIEVQRGANPPFDFDLSQ